MSFRDCIQAALETGAIDRHEADDLMRRWEALDAAEKRGEEAPGFARMELNRQLSEEAREAARVKGLKLKAANDARKDINRYALDREPDVGGAVFRMFENQGDAGFPSVRYQMSALRSAAFAEMEDAVHAFRRSGLTLQRRGNALLDEVARTAFGGSNDPGAQALYKSILKPLEKLRELFNEAGGNIAWREKWGLPMRHDAGALMAAGFDKWREFVEPRLNWDEMKHGVTGATIFPSEREAVLRHVWESVVTEGWNTRDPARPGFSAKYNQRQDARFLIFKDGDAWLDYNKAFGTGDVWKTITGHVSSLSRDVALMRRFGPNPTQTVEWLKNVVYQEAMRAKIGDPSLFKRGFEFNGRSFRSYEAAARSQQETIDGLYSLARGDTGVADGALADAGAIVRNVQYAAKLGGAVITHAVLNPIQQDLARAARGVNRLSQITSMAKAFSGMSEREATRAGLVAADALHVLEQGAREAATTSRLRSLSAWLPEATVRWSGLEAFVAAQRRAFGNDLMAHFGDRMDKPWSRLEDRTREMLSGYGIRKEEWSAIRAAEPYAPQGGAPMLRFSDIANAGVAKPGEIAALAGIEEAAAPAYMRDLAFKYLGLLHGEIERATPSSNWRVRAKLVGNSKEGTLWGEARRSVAMFKGYVGSAMVGNMQLLKQELARGNGGRLLAYGAAAAGGYLLAQSAGGVLVQQLKAIASGKDLRSTDPTTKEGRDTWLHGMLTSGGLGIFGDFLASDHSSYGHGPLETAAGPMATGAIDAYTAARTAFEGKKTLSEKLALGAVSLLRNNTPVLSTHWALRAAYNHILLDQLEYLADPAAHARWRAQESRLRKETGQGLWWPRGALAPERAPSAPRP